MCRMVVVPLVLVLGHLANVAAAVVGIVAAVDMGSDRTEVADLGDVGPLDMVVQTQGDSQETDLGTSLELEVPDSDKATVVGGSWGFHNPAFLGTLVEELVRSPWLGEEEFEQLY